MKRVVGFQGRIVQDTSKPDGTPRKLLDVSTLNALGWRARIALESGLRETYEWYRTSLMQPEHAAPRSAPAARSLRSAAKT
jgi:GDP-L-fucose synthase